MSVNALNGTGVDSIANQLLKVFDRNNDGQLSREEFGDVMRGILGNLANEAGTTAALPAASTPNAALRMNQLEGFSHDKLQTSDSVKYRFARAAAQFDVSGVNSKASAEAHLQNMKPALEGQGLDVLDIKGDRIQIVFQGNPLWVDVIRGATGTSPAYQWLPEGV